MAKAKRNAKIRRSHLKPFSSSMINTGRGPNAEVLAEYKARALTDEDRSMATFGFKSSAYAVYVARHHVVGTRKIYGKEYQITAPGKEMYRYDHADPALYGGTSVPIAVPPEVRSPRLAVLKLLQDMEKDTEPNRKIKLIDGMIRKSFMYYCKGQQSCFIVEHNLLRKQLCKSIVYSDSKKLLAKYKADDVIWSEVRSLTDLDTQSS